jgi:hypothetical protein
MLCTTYICAHLKWDNDGEVTINAEKIGMLFSPDCFDSVQLGYLNAVLNYKWLDHDYSIKRLQ